MRSLFGSPPPQPPAAAGELGEKHPSAAYWLLAMVAIMAVATSAALWWTLNQAQALSQPYEQNELWYVSRVHNELAHVSLIAHKLQAREATVQNLQERMEVLLSTLDISSRGPRVASRLRETLPDAALELDKLHPLVELWSNQLFAVGDDDTAIATDISQHSDVLLDSLRKTVATVHLFGAQEIHQARQQLHHRFLVLSIVLGGLLPGTALLIWKLVHDVRAARVASGQLALANRELEALVASRTRKIEEGRALLTFILDTSPSDMVLADAESGRVHFINRQLTERLEFGAPPTTLLLADLLHDPDSHQRFTQALNQNGQVDAMEVLIGEHRPSWSALSARLVEVEGRMAYLLWGFDISTHKALESQLRELATRDALSGLLNRRAFMERGIALFEHCRRHDQPFAVLMIDIDHFKRINDQHGHQMGDFALRACADALDRAVRNADLVGRLGGEEFAVLLPHSSAISALMIAERIRGAIEQISLASPLGELIRFTVSIGAAETEFRHANIEQALGDADLALYRAKATGRNKALAYHPAFGKPAAPASP